MAAGYTPVILGLIAVALAFDFLNGFNDAANSIATVVATRVLKPRVAVVWAAVFNFIAFLFFGLHVARTVGSGIVTPAIIDDRLIFAALIGAIVWDVGAWRAGLPTSSSHALIGGLVGAGLVKAGPGAIVALGVEKTGLGIVVSPLLGMALAIILTIFVAWLFARVSAARVDGVFRRAQLVSASLVSLSHGGNDAQKTMGVIAVLLFAHHLEHGGFHVPLWVVLACQASMGLGTFFGGWRIVRTLGHRITKLAPVQGFCAETGGGATIMLATLIGVPVSTTHTITGGVMGVGLARRAGSVRWGVARRIVIAWVVTGPMAALVAALVYLGSGLVG